jgi:transcription antitermination protein NusB
VNNISGKRNARQLAVQALYQWDMTKEEIAVIEEQFVTINNMKRVDIEYFHELIYGVVKNIKSIDAAFVPFLDRELESLNPVELAVLRLSSFELLQRLELPYQIIAKEAVVLCKMFGAQEGYRYVNGVLHKVINKYRTHE